jgi:hypothetical protein
MIRTSLRYLCYLWCLGDLFQARIQRRDAEDAKDAQRKPGTTK